MATDISTAVFDEDVQAAVAAACVVETLEPASPMSGEVTISRPAEPIDYASAISANIDKFGGIRKSDVTVDAVAAVLEAAASDA